jgi:hypothetical protein
MFLKKMALVGALSLMGMSFAAYADLTIINKTPEFSTVKVTSGALHLCSNAKAQGVTQPNSTNHVDQKLINELCIGSGKVCEANIFMTNNCSGKIARHAKLENGKISLSGPEEHPLYKVVQENDSTIRLIKR